MMAYSTEEVVDLFEGENSILDTICIEGNDDELGLEEVEIVQNPYYNHAAEFEQIKGKMYNAKPLLDSMVTAQK